MAQRLDSPNASISVRMFLRSSGATGRVPGFSGCARKRSTCAAKAMFHPLSADELLEIGARRNDHHPAGS